MVQRGVRRSIHYDLVLVFQMPCLGSTALEHLHPSPGALGGFRPNAGKSQRSGHARQIPTARSFLQGLGRCGQAPADHLNDSAIAVIAIAEKTGELAIHRNNLPFFKI